MFGTPNTRPVDSSACEAMPGPEVFGTPNSGVIRARSGAAHACSKTKWPSPVRATAKGSNLREEICGGALSDREPIILRAKPGHNTDLRHADGYEHRHRDVNHDSPDSRGRCRKPSDEICAAIGTASPSEGKDHFLSRPRVSFAS